MPRPPSRRRHARRGASSARSIGGSTRFYDWQGAGRYRVPRGAAMADIAARRPAAVRVRPRDLYLRLEPRRRRAAELAGATWSSTSPSPARVRVHVAVAARGGRSPSAVDGSCASRRQRASARTVELALTARRGARRRSRHERAAPDVPPLTRGDAPLARYPSTARCRSPSPATDSRRRTGRRRRRRAPAA